MPKTARKKAQKKSTKTHDETMKMSCTDGGGLIEEILGGSTKYNKYLEEKRDVAMRFLRIVQTQCCSTWRDIGSTGQWHNDYVRSWKILGSGKPSRAQEQWFLGQAPGSQPWPLDQLKMLRDYMVSLCEVAQQDPNISQVQSWHYMKKQDRPSVIIIRTSWLSARPPYDPSQQEIWVECDWYGNWPD